MILQINQDLTLESLDRVHSSSIFQLVTENKNYLSPWLPWVGLVRAPSFFDNYADASQLRSKHGGEFAFVIKENDTVVGRIGIYKIDTQNHSGEIGYWIAPSSQGKGLITQATQRLLKFGFEELPLNRIEIKCAIGNTKSQAVPERLGFTKEGISRQAEFLHGQYVDIVVYSKLKSEWV
ncbi:MULTISPECIES: GNAT family N-acetyltransferase [unclassified Siphonobacter]|uniref:GNAT family N-acetyltransferase n=1 Tax=unclassified Siphonobacter TaxID=2635712 RepID=UPI000CAF8944|nr:MULTISPECIES: GNAT family protein [unclassified Siphonobacter]MDQ1088120.1 ribosomal-protein-serine acetyltransferase [Siphonobacter sp. SORGH_AS_1065]MDR6194271.1 ribosomal-protein-serine acetyltransferase [Siphonobacter sp. SORGH_AS_0500]PKK37055.1 hypothetical protein BWI96_09270 [Siphonobacter sp. SORGH_AS_0500]